MNIALIVVKDLVFDYPGKRALDNVSFEIQSGSITALVGPNGAGKTTLLRCLAALEEPFSGEVFINARNTKELPRAIHREMGYLSDFYDLYDELTVRQALLYFSWCHDLREALAEERSLWAATQLQVDDLLDKKIGALSRGQRQRVAIAQTIVHKPKLLLLDEPASGLDPEARIHLSQLFVNLKQQGMTLLVSSHILAELEDYCTDMIILLALVFYFFHIKGSMNGITTTAYTIFFIAVMIVGTNKAAKAIVQEISDRTWDFQKVAPTSPISMLIGKLTGAPLSLTSPPTCVGGEVRERGVSSESWRRHYDHPRILAL